MNIRNRMAAMCGAAVLVLTPSMASAQECLQQSEVSAMAIYAMPGVVQGVNARCAARLSPGGFLAQGGGAALSDRYARLQASVWPNARAGLVKVAAARSLNEAGNADVMAMISNLPDQAVRPLIDALIVQELSPQIDLEQCGRVELLLQALSRVEPEIAGTLLGLIAGFVKLDKPAICAGAAQ